MKKKLFITGVLTTLCIFTGSIGIKASDERKDDFSMQTMVPKVEEVKKNSEVIASNTKMISNEVVENTCPQNHVNCDGNHDQSATTCPQGHANCEGKHANGVGKNECPQNHENCNGIHNQGTTTCPQGHINCEGKHANGVGKNECPQNHENCNGKHGQGNGNKFQGKRCQN